jgi:UDP-N-acetyl-D-mannosaminuronic acid dehydrogenase
MAQKYRKICVVGLGYIGLPTASLLGTKGYKVVGVDVHQKVVDTINEGKAHIEEPDLDILLKSAVQSGNLSASLLPEAADIFIIAVPTPFKDGHQPDLQYVQQATQSIAPYVQRGNLVILESTSPVGTTLDVVAEGLKASGLRVGEDIFVAHCPERVLPGRILTELVENDRIVGGINEASTQAAADFYAEFVRGEVLQTDASTAEMTKLVENTFRDVNIAFANELSVICDALNVNVWDVIALANRHPRVNILQPGPGVGGHCIAVDPWFIVARSPETARLTRTAREINDAKPDWVVDRVVAKARKYREPVIACLGITFKADVGDLRESPALYIARRLRDEKIGQVIVCEPNVSVVNGFETAPLQEAIAQADIIVLLVDHRAFRKLRATDLKEKVVIDTRGCLR